jgi:hypothetical protein
MELLAGLCPVAKGVRLLGLTLSGLGAGHQPDITARQLSLKFPGFSSGPP